MFDVFYLDQVIFSRKLKRRTVLVSRWCFTSLNWRRNRDSLVFTAFIWSFLSRKNLRRSSLFNYWFASQTLFHRKAWRWRRHVDFLFQACDTDACELCNPQHMLSLGQAHGSKHRDVILQIWMLEINRWHQAEMSLFVYLDFVYNLTWINSIHSHGAQSLTFMTLWIFNCRAGPLLFHSLKCPN